MLLSMEEFLSVRMTHITSRISIKNRYHIPAPVITTAFSNTSINSNHFITFYNIPDSQP